MSILEEYLKSLISFVTTVRGGIGRSRKRCIVQWVTVTRLCSPEEYFSDCSMSRGFQGNDVIKLMVCVIGSIPLNTIGIKDLFSGVFQPVCGEYNQRMVGVYKCNEGPGYA